MKTFLNVLYRRILYKIPLKFLLVLLAITAVFIACFSKAEDVEDLIVYSNTFEQVSVGTNYTTIVKLNGDHELKSCCVKITNYDNTQNLQIGFSMTDNGTPNRMFTYSNNGIYVCLDYYADGYLIGRGLLTKQLDGDVFVLNDLLTTPIPKLTSLQCQTEYNLIPISSVDSNYCTTNNLCPSEECPDIPVYSGDISQLYINNILHVGAPNIIMNIPDEIDWDYAYTAGGQNMNIDVVGYNVDYEKIDEVVQLQNYKPSSEDFQKIIGLLAPYTKIIVFFVFLFIVWAWIKKPFKSKKL